MTWWNDFADQMQCDVPLSRWTWYRLGGRARYLFRPRDAEQLALLTVRARHENLPVKVLGCGANVLVSDDGFDGVVVRLDGPAFRRVEHREGRVCAGAGVDLMPFSRDCSERGLSGLEFMAGIPASIGGAIRMNAGGPQGEFGDVVREVKVLTPDGAIEDWPKQRLGFGYRKSEIGDAIVLSATLELAEADPQRVTKVYDDFFEQKLSSQPMGQQSAGCVFKNPPGQSAGALIDRAGMKGTRCGEAYVSPQHANFIVADPGATASDVLGLIDKVRNRVRDVFDVELDVEIDIWRPQRKASLV